MTTITFDAIGATQSSYSEKGFTFTPAGTASDVGGRFQTVYANGSGDTASLIRMVSAAGMPFTLSSLSINQLFSGNPATTVTFSGVTQSGETVSQSATSDTDGNTSETVQLTGFTNLTSFTFNYGSNTRGINVDNIVVVDPPAAGAFSINDVSAVEGDTDAKAGFFTISREAPQGLSLGEATVTYRFAQAVPSGGGDAGQFTIDWSANASGTITFAPGQTSARVDFNILPDREIEASEFFALDILTVSGTGTIVRGRGFAEIVDNDFAGAFSVADVSVTEGDTGSQPGFFTVTRAIPANGTAAAASISYVIQPAGSSADSTAMAGVDYSAQANGTINFAVGQTSATVPFTVIGDTAAEQNETFRLLLSNASGGGTIARGVGTATIVDNDRGSTPTPTPTPTGGSQMGTSGNDVLISTNTGNSILAGGAGNDTYLVYAQSDRVIEAPNEGNDTLYTTVSYSLGEAAVEAMSVADQMTTNAVNLSGNYVSQIIVGNYGDNVLNGGSGGVDTLIGLFGNDTYAVGDARMVIVEQAGQGFDTAVTSVSYALGAGVSVEVFAAQDRASTNGLRLGGNELAQTIAGTAGADTISGGGGRDVLLGGAGADTFVIGTVATGNVAVLADFVAGTDRIGLTSTAFNVGTSLDAAEFVAGTAATTADQRVIYDTGTGQLFYDADGNGAGSAILFAQVIPGTAIAAATFDVITPTANAG